MPELLFFLPCEKAIIDSNTNELSLIGIMDQIIPLLRRNENELVDGDSLSKGAKYLLAPFQMMCLWRRSNPSDEDVSIEQYVSMTSPDGKITDLVEPITITLSRKHNRVIQGTGPITARLPGNYQLTLKCRFDGGEWSDYSQYTFLLNDFSPASTKNKTKSLQAEVSDGTAASGDPSE